MTKLLDSDIVAGIMMNMSSENTHICEVKRNVKNWRIFKIIQSQYSYAPPL